MARARRLRSPRNAFRLTVVALALAFGLTLAGSEVTASTSTLTESPSTVGNGANFTFTYSTPAATASSTNWVGIYQPGQVPGQVGSITYEYAPGPSGTVTFSTSSLNGVGQYQAYYLYDNGYQQLAGPVDFTVVGEPPAAAPQIVRVLSPAGAAALDDPFAVAVDAHGDVWVADTRNNRVEELAPNGSPLSVLGTGFLRASRYRAHRDPDAGKPQLRPLLRNVPWRPRLYRPDGNGLPIGLGFRVPVTLVSAGTVGGNVYSGVLDHTSLIRIIEARFGVMEPNISAWRRQTAGDFTAALNFSGRLASWPANPAIQLTTADSGLLTAQDEVDFNPAPTIPVVNEPFPRA